ncbi:MAG: GIY-YIG nuclease family protein [Chloroflexota bacterium]|nr:GIY-YIG nuclease family protein [Chloroflexota bacterium]
MQVRNPCVYILASRPNGAIYIGVTSNLQQRVWQHKSDFVKGHTANYQIHDLVWYEMHDNMESAITREKRLKKWNRGWKLRLIEDTNPGWKDLYEEIISW